MPSPGNVASSLPGDGRSMAARARCSKVERPAVYEGLTCSSAMEAFGARLLELAEANRYVAADGGR